MSKDSHTTDLTPAEQGASLHQQQQQQKKFLATLLAVFWLFAPSMLKSKSGYNKIDYNDNKAISQVS